MSKPLIAVIVVILGVFLFFFTSRPDTTGDTLPAFSLNSYSGELVDSSRFDGEVLVVNSWASWCPFCVKELPDFVALQEQFGDDITVVAINRRESLEVAKGYTDEHGVSDGLLYLLDPTDSFYKSIGGFSMPETVFVRKDGSIALHKRGPLPLSEMISIVEPLLE